MPFLIIDNTPDDYLALVAERARESATRGTFDGHIQNLLSQKDTLEAPSKQPRLKDAISCREQN